MKRIIILASILFCLLLPPTSASESDTNYWEIDLQNGYISTKPIIVDDQVIVRTSGFWTGEDRPNVYSFNLHDGSENWRFTNNGSTNHDMSPLLFVPAGQSSCGSWNDMVLVGWTDGKVTALDFDEGELIWESQTEVVTWGITGSMALDDGEVVVPTRQGLSKFCLSNGNETLRVDLPQLGWRNGVTVTSQHYLLGNEEGVLNTISKDGLVTNVSIGDGKIRHSPIVTSAGILIHLQTSSASEIYLDQTLISQEGSSPAIPLQVGNQIYLATSSNAILMTCDSECVVESKTQIHSNGEITRQYIPGQVDTIWFPNNTPVGGWASGIPGSPFEMIETPNDTYTTAGPGFGLDGSIAFGNDNGILMVYIGSYDFEKSNEDDDDVSSSEMEIESLVIVILILITVFFQVRKNNQMATKFGLLLLLVLAIIILPDVSNIWSKEVDRLEERPGDWDNSWPSEWKGTQVLVIELPDGEMVIGGFEDYENVEQLTDAAALDLGIEVEKETYNFGDWIISFDGHSGEGWEFTIDGQRSSVGMSLAELEEDSVVRWSPA